MYNVNDDEDDDEDSAKVFNESSHDVPSIS